VAAKARIGAECVAAMTTSRPGAAFNRPSRQLTVESKAITNSRPRLHAATVDTHAEIVQPRLRVRRPQVKRPVGGAIGD